MRRAVMTSFDAEKSPPAVSRIGFLVRPSVNAASGPPSNKENTMAKYLVQAGLWRWEQ